MNICPFQLELVYIACTIGIPLGKGVIYVICIGSVSIQNVSGSANVQFGNIINRAPNNLSKTTAGAGAENEGMLIITNSGFSLTITSPTTAGTGISAPTPPSITIPSTTPANPFGSVTSS
ncbi:spore germination protein [Niallia sp. XMNu-256]|uniref:spore germination protein n=1 Tax=Niallia sp. XMNu-256 TaxID=3082444 RepID=UPI0030D44EAF